jgi:AcrR family transcriptional regulator
MRMPRGVAMHGARDQLFDAAERVLARVGPAGLTSRAVTDEAGVAKGLIYRYFADLDEFLAELTAARVRSAVAAVSGLPDRAGHGTVNGNLGEALLALLGPGSHVPLVTAIVTSRPSLMGRLHQVLDATSALGEIEASLAAYIAAEQRLGRLARSADPALEAAILFGAVHHLVFTGRSAVAEFPDQVRQMVTAVITGMDSGQDGSARS